MAKTRGATSGQPLPGGIVTAMFTDIVDSTHPKEAQLGKGLLALVSQLGQHHDGWVPAAQIFEGFARHKIPEEKTASLLSQLTRTCILDEANVDDQLRYRLSVPLVQERFVRQNLYLKYFRSA